MTETPGRKTRVVRDRFTNDYMLAHAGEEVDIRTLTDAYNRKNPTADLGWAEMRNTLKVLSRDPKAGYGKKFPAMLALEFLTEDRVMLPGDAATVPVEDSTLPLDPADEPELAEYGETDESEEPEGFDLDGHHEAITETVQFFDSRHLPDHLRRIAQPIEALVAHLLEELDDSRELAHGMRALLIAKDCFVRCAVQAART